MLDADRAGAVNEPSATGRGRGGGGGTLGVEAGEAVAALAGKCERAARRAGLKPETRNFHPHMTIAYLQGTPVDKANRFTQRASDLETEAWMATHFSLCSSWITRGDANIYQAEADYPLA